MSPIVKKTGLLFGIALGLLLMLVSAYIYFLDQSKFNDVVVGMLSLLAVVVFGAVAALVARKRLGGYATFREAFAAYFLTVVLARALQCVFSIGVTSFVLDDQTKASMKQQMYEFNIKLMKTNLAPKKDLDQMTKNWPSYDPFAVSEVLKPSLLYLLRDCLVGFLVALAIRNKRALIQ